MNIYYVYAYLRKDGTPYYIGKGKENRAFTKSKREVSKPTDISRIVFYHQNLTEHDAYTLEIKYILLFGRKNIGTGILRNQTAGGLGGSKKGVRGPQKNPSLTRKPRPPISEETRNKIRLAKLGKKQTLESNIKRSKKLSGKPKLPESIKKRTESRKIKRLTLS